MPQTATLLRWERVVVREEQHVDPVRFQVRSEPVGASQEAEVAVDVAFWLCTRFLAPFPASPQTTGPDGGRATITQRSSGSPGAGKAFASQTTLSVRLVRPEIDLGAFRAPCRIE